MERKTKTLKIRHYLEVSGTVKVEYTVIVPEEATDRQVIAAIEDAYDRDGYIATLPEFPLTEEEWAEMEADDEGWPFDVPDRDQMHDALVKSVIGDVIDVHSGNCNWDDPEIVRDGEEE